jgi:arsenite methyltransferase
MSVTAARAKSCCATAYSSEAARFLLGDSFHPGGDAITDELARALAAGPGDLVIDIASGPGSSTERVERLSGCDVLGIDISPATVSAARGRAVARREARALRFVCGDAEALPLADASVDGALCECAFCLFPDKPKAAAEIARVLRPGARLALSDVWVDRDRLAPELLSLDAYIACLAEALPLARTAEVFTDAGLTIERSERRDEVIAPMLERIAARLRLARLIGGGPLAGVIDRAERLVAAAEGALRDGALGYGIVVARH